MNIEIKKGYATVAEASEATGYSKKRIYNLLDRIPEIKREKIGNKIIVCVNDLLIHKKKHDSRKSIVWGDTLSEDEQFKPILGYDERYIVGDKGTIYNVSTGHIIGNNLRNDGYMAVAFLKDGKCEKNYHHVVVGNYWVPNVLNKPIFHHINCDRGDNNPLNLLAVTSNEHTSLHKLLREKKYREYHLTIDSIQKDNEAYEFEIQHPDYESTDTNTYVMRIDKAGYLAHKRGEDIPPMSIKGEYQRFTNPLDEVLP